MNYMHNYVKNIEEITQNYNFINKTIYIYLWSSYLIVYYLKITLKLMYTYIVQKHYKLNTQFPIHDSIKTLPDISQWCMSPTNGHRYQKRTNHWTKRNRIQQIIVVYIKVIHSARILPSTKTSSNFLAKFMPCWVNTCWYSSWEFVKSMIRFISGSFSSIFSITILFGIVFEWEANSCIPSRVLLQDMYLESGPYDPYDTWESIVTSELGAFAFKPLAGSSSGLSNLYKIFKKNKIAYYWYVYIYNYLRIFSFIIHNSWVKECKLSFLSKGKNMNIV